MEKAPKKEYDVIIIGGGITGVGTARDCAMRGLNVILIEKHDLTNGATGRNHGLLHSGARYAVTDIESARECISENKILRKIARHCVEDTDGLFISLPEDDLNYQEKFVDACQKAGINANIINPAEAIRIEPSVNKKIIGAVKVPDAAIDPFMLTTANILDAKLHGADILTYHEVIDIIVKNGQVEGVKIRDNRNGVQSEIRGRITVNASGIWSKSIAQMAGVTINMLPSKGSLLVFGHRVNKMVINRCRKPNNADILVPNDTVSVIGTTSTSVPMDTIDNLGITPDEIHTLLTEGIKLSPSLASTRILRAYAGIRPLVSSEGALSGRSASRGIILIDHEKRDGLSGLITITGGKMMTYRLMAEKTTDLVCEKLGRKTPCKTGTMPLPGSENLSNSKNTFAHHVTFGRHGTMTNAIEKNTSEDRALVCECEEVSVGEIKYAVEKLQIRNLMNLRRRTRIGMGTCQGELCAMRAAGVLCHITHAEASQAILDLASSIQERWKGMQPVAWGDTLKENQLNSIVYNGLCGLDKIIDTKLLSKA